MPSSAPHLTAAGRMQICIQKPTAAAHLAAELVGDLAEDGLQRAAGPAGGAGVQHHQQPVALVVQLAQRQLAPASARRTCTMTRAKLAALHMQQLIDDWQSGYLTLQAPVTGRCTSG